MAVLLAEANEEIRGTEISVVLRHFILQNRVITKGIPREMRKEAMVLMEIAAIVSENQLGRGAGLERFEIVLNCRSLKWEITVAKL